MYASQFHQMIASFDYPYPDDEKFRVFGTFSNPLFLEYDIKRLLGIEQIHTTKYTWMVGPDVLVTPTNTIDKSPQMKKTITQSGLCYIAARSQKTIAVNSWLYETVFPSISKQATSALLEERETVLVKLTEENKQLKIEKQQIEEKYNKLMFDIAELHIETTRKNKKKMKMNNLDDDCNM